MKKMPSLFNFFNTAAYLIGWLTLVLFGSEKALWPLGLSAVFMTSQLFYLYKYDLYTCYVDLFFLFYTTIFGLILECVLVNFQWIGYIHHSGFFPPLWIIFLYPLFALYWRHGFSFIVQNFYTCIITAALAGGFLYPAASYLGVAFFPVSFEHSFFFLILAWVLLFLSLHLIEKKLKKTAEKSLYYQKQTRSLMIFFDKRCGVCDFEIRSLKKRKKHTEVDYIDIFSPDFDKITKTYHLSTKAALERIHCLWNQKTLFQALQAFHVIYAVHGKVFLSIAIRLPLLKILFDKAYALFARYRHLLP